MPMRRRSNGVDGMALPEEGTIDSRRVAFAWLLDFSIHYVFREEEHLHSCHTRRIGREGGRRNI